MKLKTILSLLMAIMVLPMFGQFFTDASGTTGFNAQGRNNGVAIGDYDGDGYDDIYVSSKDGPNLLYRNLRNGQFEELGSELGVDYSAESNTSIWFDLENDGDLDLYVGNYQEQNILYRNDDGQFVDVTNQYNVGSKGRIVTLNAADIDNDGDLDLYVGYFNARNKLYRNEGSYFIDVAGLWGLNASNPSMGAIFFDYDNDGDLDLYQTNDANIPNELYRNDGDKFTDVSEFSGLNYAGFGMGVDVADLDNDGYLDVYVTNLYSNVLYQNRGDGTFYDLSSLSNTDDIGMGWGTLIFDCNNDGLRDIYLGNDTYFGVNGVKYPNRLFENLGSFVFYGHDESSVVTSRFATYGAAALDLENDGNLDLAVVNSGDDGNQFFRNEHNQNDFVSIKLIGNQSNYNGIGARLELYYGGESQNDIITCGSGYASQSTMTTYFGIEEGVEVDSLIVRWPSGIVQTITDLRLNQLNTIEEDNGIQALGQVVWTDPPFPTQFDDVTVYFDAKEGNGALQGFNGQVFAHTGLITNQSSNGNDWKHVVGNWGTFDSRVIMTNEGDDVYSISYNIEDFYGIPQGEEVLQMAFVFRNVNGTIVGRDADGSDIFTDVFPPDEGLLATINSPLENQTVLELGDSLRIQMQVNKRAFVQITDDGEEVYADSTDLVDFWLSDLVVGSHELVFNVSDEEDEVQLMRQYIVLDLNQNLVDAPEGVRDGVNFHSDSSLVFQLFAPGKDYVFLLCPANNFEIDADYVMNKSVDGSHFWIELSRELFENGNNLYQYHVDGALTIADAYSKIVLDPNNDPFVDASVMNQLPDYPSGMTNGIVSVIDLKEGEYNWVIDDFEKPAKADLVIYELLIRDFLEDHSYSSLIDSLDYLQNLGINAIELMPVFEFEGNISWGYNPSFHMAVDKYYGSVDDLKRFIDEAHQRGIAVILDVVFNHAFSQSPLAQLYWNSSVFKPAANNPYLNEDPKHPFNVGYDFNHESQATRNWVKRNLEQWIQEFKFDGFRFDLSKGLTQRNSGNDSGFMAQYDASRIAILKDYADYIWSLDHDNYVILEHFANNDEETELANYGMMLWGNSTFDFAESAMGYSRNLDWADYKERGWNDPHLVAYMESHDEQRMMYKLENFGDQNSEYSTRNLENAVERISAAATIFYSIPGPKMLWQFGELAYDFPINYCPNGTINENCRVDPKPIRWDYLENEYRKELYDVMGNIIYLKTNYPTFSTDDYVFNDGNFFLKTVNLNHPEMDAVSMANFRIINSELNPKFPYEGVWYEYFTGDSLIVTNTQEKLEFQPGEYRIYTSEQITPPRGFTTSVKEPVYNTVSIYPNPVRAGEDIYLSLESYGKVEQSYLTSVTGQRTALTVEQDVNGASLRVPDLESGVYFVEIFTDDQVIYNSKVVVID